jgi:hypothetical protein
MTKVAKIVVPEGNLGEGLSREFKVLIGEGDTLAIRDGALLIMNGTITCNLALAPGYWISASIERDDSTVVQMKPKEIRNENPPT